MKKPEILLSRLRTARVVGFVLVSAVLPGTLRSAPQADRRPNIVLCIADDWSWPHAGVYGDRVVSTPTFDRLAREGALFTRAFCATPSCTPSRAAILTGQYPHRLQEGANLWGFLPNKFAVYPSLLEQAGYVVGLKGKGWGPGNFQAGGWKRNPAGPQVKSFEQFLKTVPPGTSFCFWFGSSDPHRPYDKGTGAASGLKPEQVIVPPYLPDTPEIRSDLLDYYFEVQRFDRDVGEIVKALEAAGLLDQTLLVVTSDNGMPFPRCKTNLHDSGTHMPLAIRWPGRIKAGLVIDAFVHLSDLAPTFLEAAGLKPGSDMTGRSLVPLLEGRPQEGRDHVFLERERHANVREGDLGYPVRALRTKDFLYLRNLRSDRWPAGDPEKWKAVGPFGDCDGSPTKDLILARRQEESIAGMFHLGFDKRAREEFYDLTQDPHQLRNVASQPGYAEARQRLRAQLDQWMKDTGDPRAAGGGDEFDRYPYFGDARRASPNLKR